MTPPLRILVAEDEPLNALALRDQLGALGHEVVGPASSGTEAVVLARGQRPDLALLDIRMPGLTGLQAAREMFRTRPLPIILLTGFDDPESVEQAAESPIFHYLIKPVSREDLAPAIAVARKRFEEWAAFRADADRLQRELERRRLVEQAKGVLMRARGLRSDEAERVLETESERRGEPVAEIARSIVTADALLFDPRRS